jgi:hypothetical protein
VSIHAGQRFSAHVDRVGGAALTVLVFGWRSAHWWQRICSAASIPLCLLCAVLLLNMWVGYVRTVEAAWHFATVGPPPNQADLATVKAMAANGTVPHKGPHRARDGRLRGRPVSNTEVSWSICHPRGLDPFRQPRYQSSC